ncbi:unnamed protein product [Protopolystoma xenopodis]|uniref:Uncharacterized protein n=1 Tax=Protopolystoma xenopodis TaxID=117903 RepID=A0A448WV92_9PLAT|nr:unnamed protein product [Protopolystoma xenopodis]
MGKTVSVLRTWDGLFGPWGMGQSVSGWGATSLAVRRVCKQDKAIQTDRENSDWRVMGQVWWEFCPRDEPEADGLRDRDTAGTEPGPGPGPGLAGRGKKQTNTTNTVSDSFFVHCALSERTPEDVDSTNRPCPFHGTCTLGLTSRAILASVDTHVPAVMRRPTHENRILNRLTAVLYNSTV